MRLRPVPVVGGCYADDTKPYSSQDCVNWIPEPAEVGGGRSDGILRQAPGLALFSSGTATVDGSVDDWTELPAEPVDEVSYLITTSFAFPSGSNPPFPDETANIGDIYTWVSDRWERTGSGAGGYTVRGLRNVEGALYAVIDTTLYKINTDGSKASLGTIAGTGRCSMTHNQITGGNEVVIVNGSQGYVLNTASNVLTQIDDVSFEGSIITAYLNQYVLHIEPQKRYWFHSDLADALQYISTDRYEGESNPDRMVSLLVDHQEVWIFNERSIDIFVNTGNESATFERATGTSIELGCASTFSPAKMDNSVFWLGNDGIFYRANGYSPQRISTHAIEQAITDLDWSQCFSMVYEDRGHKIVYWTFADGQTWGYDVSSQTWHRRKSYGYSNWRVNHLVYWDGRWIAGDSVTGNLYEMDWDEYTENGAELERVRVTAVMHADQNRFRVDGVELVVSVGVSAVSNTDYTLDLSWSDDGGYTYTSPAPRSLGSQGSYYTRLLWRRLGMARNRVWKIAVSSPVKVDVIAASASMAA